MHCLTPHQTRVHTHALTVLPSVLTLQFVEKEEVSCTASMVDSFDRSCARCVVCHSVWYPKTTGMGGQSS
jgi:hypothetical protein